MISSSCRRKKERVIKIGTDCSGIEAPIQALRELGIKHLHMFSSDIDPYCRKSILANYHPLKLYKDMTKRKVSELADIDLYVCGFPCQSFSMAGKRKGMKEKRGQLFWHCLEVIEETLPSVFILENVKGLLSIDQGKTFEEIIDSLEEISDGLYEVDWKVLNTKDYGIPQNRERLFIVGTRKDKNISFKGWPSPTRMKPLDSFIDWDDKLPNKSGLTSRVKKMQKKIPKNSKFIDLSFKHATYPNSDKICPALIRSGSLWCVPLKRYANVNEMLSLQGFPKVESNTSNTSNTSNKNKKHSFKQVVSNTQLKKQIGNSMSVCVLKELFKKIYR